MTSVDCRVISSSHVQFDGMKVPLWRSYVRIQASDGCKSAFEVAPLLENSKPTAHRSRPATLADAKLESMLTNENNKKLGYFIAQGSKNRSPRRHLATCSAALATRKKSRSPSQGSPQKRVFDFSGFEENLVAFCRLECFAGFTFLPADGHSASLKLNQRDETFPFPSYFLLNRATGDPRVASNAPLEPHARQATVLSAREFR